MVRFKNRYLLCELVPYGQHIPELTEKALANAIRDEVLSNFGELGLAQIYFSFQVKYWNQKTRLAILRVPRDHINILQTSLALMKSIQGALIKVRVLHCSGTIRKTERRTVRLLKTWLNAKILHGELKYVSEAEQLHEKMKKDIMQLES